MLGRPVEVLIDKQWFKGRITEAETGARGNSMTVMLLPSQERILPAYVVVAPESESRLWRQASQPGGDLSGEDLPVVGRGVA